MRTTGMYSGPQVVCTLETVTHLYEWGYHTVHSCRSNVSQGESTSIKIHINTITIKFYAGKRSFWYGQYLLIDTDSIQSIVHYVHPTVFGSQNKKGHEGLREVKDDKKKRLKEIFDFSGSIWLCWKWDEAIMDSFQIGSGISSRL